MKVTNSMNARAMLAGLMFTSLVVHAVNAAETREATPGYGQDSSNNVIRTDYGDCLHTGSWTPDKASIVGCDDVSLVHTIEVIEGAPSGLMATVTIPAASLCAFDSAELNAEGRDAIEEYRKQLRPEFSEAYAGVIIGHTDSTGDSGYNMDLSKRRAQAVADYLVSTGVEAGKLRTIGRGKYEPIASNESEEGRAQNRRVDIIVVAEPRALDTIRFPSVALFPRRSAEITEAGRAIMEQNRAESRELLSRASYIEVVGHTDDVGDDAYNQELSEQRAAAVRDYLVETGVDASKIVTIGAGENSPVASNTTDEGRAENRRVDVLVLGRVK